MTDFENYLLSLYTQAGYDEYIKKNKITDVIPTVKSKDYHVIRAVAKGATKHHLERLENIKNNILKMNIGIVKKYQVRGWKEAKNILIFCKSMNDNTDEKKFESEIISDSNLTTNKLDKIYKGYDSDCCYSCDGNPEFVNIKVSVLYVKVKRVA